MNESRKPIPLLEVCVFFYAGIETLNIVSVYVYHEKGFYLHNNEQASFRERGGASGTSGTYLSFVTFPRELRQSRNSERNRVTFFFMFTLVSKLSPSL